MASSIGGISGSPRLGKDNLGELLSKLYPVRANWYNLGLGLGISCDDLDAIKKDCKENTGECLRELLKLWLGSKNPAEMSGLIKALGEKIVGEDALANKLLAWSPSSHSLDVQKQNSPSNFSSAKTVPYPEAKDLRSNSNPTQSDSTTQTELNDSPGVSRIQCCASPESDVPCIQNTGLSHKQQENLEYRTKLDLKRIVSEFSVLQSKIRLSLKQNDITAKDIASHVIGYGISQANELSLLKKDSLDDVFILLSSKCWSFLDCDLLVTIVDVYGTEKVQQMMQEFIDKQKDFCRRRVSELPLSSTSKSEAPVSIDEEMIIKLDVSDSRLSDVKKTKIDICRILDVTDCTSIAVRDIRKGCVEVTFFIPKHLVEIILTKPLTREQCTAFRAASVISLSIGHFKKTFMEMTASSDDETESESVISEPVTVSPKEGHNSMQLDTDSSLRAEAEDQEIVNHLDWEEPVFIDPGHTSMEQHNFPKEQHNFPKQQILHRLNPDYLTAGDDGFYYNIRDYNLNEVGLLGEGEFGSCRIAQDRSTEKMFVIKQNKNERFDSIRNECFVLSRLPEHNNIIQFLGAVLDEKELEFQPPLVCKMMMELAENGNLAEMLKDEYGMELPLMEDQSLYYLQQILDGVYFLHQSGFLHLDIKTQNILVFDGGRTVKLTDFGTAVAVDKATAAFKGWTPYFVAPEVVRGEVPKLSADIWSVLCILVEMLTAKWPGCFHFMRSHMAMMFLIGSYREDQINELVPLDSLDVKEEVKQLFRDVFKAEPSARPTAWDLLQRPVIVSAVKYARYFDENYESEEELDSVPPTTGDFSLVDNGAHEISHVSSSSHHSSMGDVVADLPKFVDNQTRDRGTSQDSGVMRMGDLESSANAAMFGAQLSMRSVSSGGGGPAKFVDNQTKKKKRKIIRPRPLSLAKDCLHTPLRSTGAS